MTVVLGAPTHPPQTTGTFKGCTTNAYTRGLCVKHGAKGACSVPGCNTGARAKGLCFKHRHLDPRSFQLDSDAAANGATGANGAAPPKKAKPAEAGRKRGRGRPKGSKNGTSSVVAMAERAANAATDRGVSGFDQRQPVAIDRLPAAGGPPVPVALTKPAVACSKERTNPYTKVWRPRANQHDSVRYNNSAGAAAVYTAAGSPAPAAPASFSAAASSDHSAASNAPRDEQDAVALLLGLTSTRASSSSPPAPHAALPMVVVAPAMQSVPTEKEAPHDQERVHVQLPVSRGHAEDGILILESAGTPDMCIRRVGDR